MQTIKSILDEIASEPGTNKKMDILESHKNNPTLKRVLYLANSKRIKFYIKNIPAYFGITSMMSLEAALDSLNDIIERKKTGGAAIQLLEDILSSLHKDDAYVIERIIDKDCKIGMGTTNINKIFPGLIEDTPYMGALPFNKELAREICSKGYAYSQIKMDGRYANAIIRGGDVDLESRAGEPTILDGAKFVKEMSRFEDCVLNGEITMDGVTRYQSNGIVASLVSIGKKKKNGENVGTEVQKFEKKNGMRYQEALDKLRFTAWDVITIDEYFDMKSDIPYHDRLVKLSAVLKDKPTMVSFIRTKKVYSYDQAMSDFQEVLARGEEGTILKEALGPWRDGKHKNQCKMKLEMTVDLKIVGFNYGTGKNAELISSLNAESSDGLVFTRPTGIDENTMRYITDNQPKLLGAIVETKCCGLSHDSSGKHSLLHPVFNSIRSDKNTCDSLSDIQKIEAMAKGLGQTVNS